MGKFIYENEDKNKIFNYNLESYDLSITDEDSLLMVLNFNNDISLKFIIRKDIRAPKIDDINKILSNELDDCINNKITLKMSYWELRSYLSVIDDEKYYKFTANPYK